MEALAVSRPQNSAAKTPPVLKTFLALRMTPTGFRLHQVAKDLVELTVLEHKLRPKPVVQRLDILDMGASQPVSWPDRSAVFNEKCDTFRWKDHALAMP